MYVLIIMYVVHTWKVHTMYFPSLNAPHFIVTQERRI